MAEGRDCRLVCQCWGSIGWVWRRSSSKLEAPGPKPPLVLCHWCPCHQQRSANSITDVAGCWRWAGSSGTCSVGLQVPAQRRRGDAGRTTPRTSRSSCKVLVILILHQTSTGKPRVRAARTPAGGALLEKWQKPPSPSRTSAKELLDPSRSDGEDTEGPFPAPGRPRGRRAGSEHRAAGSCRGLQGSEQSGRAKERLGSSPGSLAGTCPSSKVAVTGAISENPSVWYAAPHRNTQRKAVKQEIKWSDIFAVSVTLEIQVEFS